jgi:hypothetical protein
MGRSRRELTMEFKIDAVNPNLRFHNRLAGPAPARE